MSEGQGITESVTKAVEGVTQPQSQGEAGSETTESATQDKETGAPAAESGEGAGQEAAESATEDKKDSAQPQAKGEKSSFLQKPQNLGNTAGQKIESVLSPVSNTVGKPLEMVGRPVGGVVDPTVGGLMRTAEAFGNQASVGYGNKDGGPREQERMEHEKMKEPIGGKEQNADNPLGL